MYSNFDLIVVGGGVLGTFHAYHALKHGLRVCLIEQNTHPIGATTRNFGQVVPSGMNAHWQQYGIRSLQIYQEIQQLFDISVRQNGSVYLASDAEEELLLEELAAINRKNGYTSYLINWEDCLRNYPGLNPEYVRSGLFFPDEITVEPEIMIHRVHSYMKEKFNLPIYYGVPVLDCSICNGNSVTVTLAGGKYFEADRAIVCNGSDFKTLFPERFANSTMQLSKLQMMITQPQPKSFKLPGSILTGWSIRRYEAFAECPSYASIKSRESKESPQKKWGVHILFKQAADGSVIIGDSHQYAPASNIESLGYQLDMDIDDFMLSEATKIITLPSYKIQKRWYGVYSQTDSGDIYNESIEDKIHIITGIGGKGMTGSPGYAEESILRIFNI